MSSGNRHPNCGFELVDSNKIEIFGRRYSISGDHDRAYLERLAGLLDESMRQIAASTGTVDTLKIAILAALNIADSHIKALEQQKRDEEEMERNLLALSEQIELALSP